MKKERNGIIIAGFPGCGKSTAKNIRGDLTISDSDSSKFHWVINEETNEKELNPMWPNNYIAHIYNMSQTSDFVFVSSHSEILNLMLEKELEFVLVYPDKSLKEEYIQRYIDRGSDESFVNLLREKWDSFMEDMKEMSNKIPFSFVLQENQFISDVLKPISLLPHFETGENPPDDMHIILSVITD